jgi:hypothetical protein
MVVVMDGFFATVMEAADGPTMFFNIYGGDLT